jgi:hypothetical protein
MLAAKKVSGRADMPPSAFPCMLTALRPGLLCPPSSREPRFTRPMRVAVWPQDMCEPLDMLAAAVLLLVYDPGAERCAREWADLLTKPGFGARRGLPHAPAATMQLPSSSRVILSWAHLQAACTEVRSEERAASRWLGPRTRRHAGHVQATLGPFMGATAMADIISRVRAVPAVSKWLKPPVSSEASRGGERRTRG